MRETKVEEHLRKQVIANGGWIRKMAWPGHVGSPDRLVIWPPLDRNSYDCDRCMPTIDFVELKRPKGPTADHQIREHDKLLALDCTVLILDSIEAVDCYIAERTS